jgi:hypothetical protein
MRVFASFLLGVVAFLFVAFLADAISSPFKKTGWWWWMCQAFLGHNLTLEGPAGEDREDRIVCRRCGSRFVGAYLR